MRAARALACGIGLASTLGIGCGGEETPGESYQVGARPERDLATDDRIAWLLAPCAHPEPFLGDTTDPIAILVSKIGSGQLDPMRLAKSELAAMGEAALPELRRFCEARFSDPGAAASLLNGLAVLGAMKTDAVREVLLTALGHPQDTVRIEAVRGLAVHAAPEDYDRIAALIPISTPTALTEIGAALAHADRARAEDQYVAWLAEPREPASLWIGAAERFCDTDRPEILARFRELAPRLQGEDQAYLMAGLARHGDDAALGVLRSESVV